VNCNSSLDSQVLTETDMYMQASKLILLASKTIHSDNYQIIDNYVHDALCSIMQQCEFQCQTNNYFASITLMTKMFKILLQTNITVFSVEKLFLFCLSNICET